MFLAYMALRRREFIYGTESYFTCLDFMGAWVFTMSANNWLYKGPNQDPSGFISYVLLYFITFSRAETQTFRIYWYLHDVILFDLWPAFIANSNCFEFSLGHVYHTALCMLRCDVINDEMTHRIYRTINLFTIHDKDRGNGDYLFPYQSSNYEKMYKYEGLDKTFRRRRIQRDIQRIPLFYYLTLITSIIASAWIPMVQQARQRYHWFHCIIYQNANKLW